MKKIIVFGLYVSERVKNASEVQRILTEYGCNIKTRVGIHETDENLCSTNGIILLEMFGDESLIEEAEQKIKMIDGCQIQKMVFEK